MKATICDICKEPIADPEKWARRVDIAGGESLPGAAFDICRFCYESPIILSEQRRTRTRKPKAKVGRPKGRKNTPVPVPEPTEAA